ncbi:MFS transporter [Brevibacillus fulvus]|uniref:MFS family permease n=1 Tax=Brevibacillus fulvus TaxID=1125967 RepID=A0A939BQL6_9BACL|nr:MFS transporter [Brevibacillus fulvus]MBM7588498.1 MFS family permease [Brevibacillus fulvus]
MIGSPLWLLLAILFLCSFDSHAQLPLLSPYLHLLGASTAMIGIVMGAYSISNLTGNLIAGPLLDRFSKKLFITVGLLFAGALLMGQGFAEEPDYFLYLRLALGFVMAFVSPACYAILAQHGRTLQEQGELMAKSGMVMTAASIVSPSIGAYLAAHFGYANAFLLFGAIMMVASALALFRLTPKQAVSKEGKKEPEAVRERAKVWQYIVGSHWLYLVFISGFAVLYAQGTLVYEVPLLILRQQLSPSVTGALFSVMGLGSLLVLAQMWLSRTQPQLRIFFGLLALSLLMYLVAVGLPFSLYVLMFLAGACFGLLFPAIKTLLAQQAPPHLYGSLFSLFSAVLSIGTSFSPLVSGFIDNLHHAFFIAFFVLMTCSLLCLLQFGVVSRARE